MKQSQRLPQPLFSALWSISAPKSMKKPLLCSRVRGSNLFWFKSTLR